MVESTHFRKTLFSTAFRMCVLDVTIILLCMFDSEIRWYSKEDYDDVFFN